MSDRICKNHPDRYVSDCLYCFADLSRRIESLQEGLTLLYAWAWNWDSPFMEDDDWRETDGPKIEALLQQEKPGE